MFSYVDPENSVSVGRGGFGGVMITFFLSSTFFTEGCTNLPKKQLDPRGLIAFRGVCTRISKESYSHL